MNRKLALAVMFVIPTFGFSPVAAHADSVTFTLTDTVVSISSSTGGVAIYEATVSAPTSNGADVFLNGDSFNVPLPLTLDDTDFYSNAPLLLAPGHSSVFDIFTVSVPQGTVAGDYAGSFTILGGATGTSSDTLGTVDFVTAVTPEPPSVLLFVTGILGLAGLMRRNQFTEQ